MDLNNFIKKILPKGILNSLRKVIVPEKLALIDRDLKSIFLHNYSSLAGNVNQKDDLRNHEFSVYSKVGEDGLIAYIFSKIGVTNRTFVEFGIQDGKECNTANLSLNFGWQGFLVDSKQHYTDSANAYYRGKLGQNCGVKAVSCFISTENVNQLLSDNGFNGEIDLLSIDIDGNDYWIWKALNVVNPRLVVAEYNTVFGPDKSLTIRYNVQYIHHNKKDRLYYGASLAALKKLANDKGYILIGCDSEGHDAFFVRKDLAEGKFKELSPKEAFYPMKRFIEKFGSLEQQFDTIKHLDFVEI